MMTSLIFLLSFSLLSGRYVGGPTETIKGIDTADFLYPQKAPEIVLTPIECRCSSGYCMDGSDVCTSEAGTCFVRTQGTIEDGREFLDVIEHGCLANGIEHDYFKDFECENNPHFECCWENMCNDKEYIELAPTQYTTTQPPHTVHTRRVPKRIRPDQTESLTEGNLTYQLYVVGALVFLIAMVLGGMLLLRFCTSTATTEKLIISRPMMIPYMRRQTQDMTTSYSSGSGNPRMTEKTLIREITFCELMGKGRYGEVWRGSWRAGVEVAIKVFSNMEEGSWWHEAEMYQNYWLRHENILSFIGADQRDCVVNMKYYLVLHFHPRGSLYDYLQNKQLTVQECIRMVVSLSSGLDYLHTDIKSSIAKPSIAHRDLKSKNILVKNNGECCIADFGLAVRSDTYESQPNPKHFHFLVGTRRYMAPEILDSSINLNTFESLKKADMYMFGLVTWELGQRVSTKPLPYQYPFQHDVPCDPTVEEMTVVVATKRKRPALDPIWSSHTSMIELARIVRECWDSDPDIRLTCLRVKKDLIKLVESLKFRDSGCYFTDTSDQGFISWD